MEKLKAAATIMEEGKERAMSQWSDGHNRLHADGRNDGGLTKLAKWGESGRRATWLPEEDR